MEKGILHRYMHYLVKLLLLLFKRSDIFFIILFFFSSSYVIKKKNWREISQYINSCVFVAQNLCGK